MIGSKETLRKERKTPGRGTGFLRPCSANPLPGPLHAMCHFILTAALAGPYDYSHLTDEETKV